MPVGGSAGVLVGVPAPAPDCGAPEAEPGPGTPPPATCVDPELRLRELQHAHVLLSASWTAPGCAALRAAVIRGPRGRAELNGLQYAPTPRPTTPCAGWFACSSLTWVGICVCRCTLWRFSPAQSSRSWRAARRAVSSAVSEAGGLEAHNVKKSF